MKRKLLVSIPVIIVLLLSVAGVAASSGWSQDVAQPGWDIVDMTNNTTNGVLDKPSATVAGTTNGQFDVNYEKFVEGGHWEYADKVVDVPGHYDVCPAGYEVDPANEAQCRIWVTGGHYDYTAKVVDVPGHYDVCPAGYEVDPANEAQCRIWVVSEVCEDVCPTNLVFTASRQVCPTDVSAYTSHTWKSCGIKVGLFHWHYADYITETFSVTFSYDKWAHDPHKCHRPTAESLDIPSWARADFNRQFPEWKCTTEVCTDTSHWEYIARTWIPDTYTCPAGYEEDPENTQQCRIWIDTSAFEYVERPWVDETLTCPAGYEPNPEGANCRIWIDESGWVYMTVTYYINVPEPPEEPKPVCDPYGGCTGAVGLWENVMGGFETNSSNLYGSSPQTMDVTWTSADICRLTEGSCEPSIPWVVIKVRSVVGQTAGTQTNFTIIANGIPFQGEVVAGADGVDWFVFRAQYLGVPIYEGVNIIDTKDLWVMDPTGLTHWWETNEVSVRDYRNGFFTGSCSDAPDFGDTRIVDGVKQMGRFPGMNTWDVAHFLALNGVPQPEADSWAADIWHALEFNTYAPLPASFNPVLP